MAVICIQYQNKVWIIQLYGNMVEKKLIPTCFLIFFLILRWLPFMSQGVIHSEIELYSQGKVFCNFMEVRSVICNFFLWRNLGWIYTLNMRVNHFAASFFIFLREYTLCLHCTMGIGDSEKVMRVWMRRKVFLY